MEFLCFRMGAYPTKEEFAAMLAQRDLDELVDEHIFQGVPYAFQGREAAYCTWAEKALEEDGAKLGGIRGEGGREPDQRRPAAAG